MARRPLHRLASLALLGLLVACGGGGGDPPAEPRERVDFTGRWSIVDNYEIYRSNSNSCLVGEGVQKWTFNVTQDENGKVLVTGAPWGTFEGQVQGNRLAWEGTWLEIGPNRWTVMRGMVLDWQANGDLRPGEGLQDIALGTGFFDYYENIGKMGALLCGGESHLSALRTN